MDVIEIGSNTPGSILTRLQLENPKAIITAAVLGNGTIHTQVSTPISIGDLLFMQKLIGLEIDKIIFGNLRQEPGQPRSS